VMLMICGQGTAATTAGRESRRPAGGVEIAGGGMGDLRRLGVLGLPSSRGREGSLIANGPVQPETLEKLTLKKEKVNTSHLSV